VAGGQGTELEQADRLGLLPLFSDLPAVQAQDGDAADAQALPGGRHAQLQQLAAVGARSSPACRDPVPSATMSSIGTHRSAMAAM
jgi:hypothetical protein